MQNQQPPNAQNDLDKKSIDKKALSRKDGFFNNKSSLFVTLLLAIVSLLVIGEILGWPFLKRPAENYLSSTLQRTVKFTAPLKIHFFGGVHVQTKGIEIGSPKEIKADYFLIAKDFDIKLRYTDLINMPADAPYQIKSLQVAEIQTNLIRNADGFSTWNFSDEPSLRPFPVFDNLSIKSGKAIYQDTVTAADLVLTFSNQEGQDSELSNSTVAIAGKYAGHPIKGEIETQGLMNTANQFASKSQIKSKMWVDYRDISASYRGYIIDPMSKHELEGNFQVKGPSLALLGTVLGATLPTTNKFDLRGSIKNSDSLWSAILTTANIGNSRLQAELDFDKSKTPALLSGRLHGKKFFLADLAPAFGTKNVEGKAVPPPAGKVLPDRPLNLPSLNLMDADIAIDLSYVDLGNVFNQPISPFKAKLNLQQGRLALNDIEATTAAGSIAGSFFVDAHAMENVAKGHLSATTVARQYEGKQPIWGTNLSWKNINLEKWIDTTNESLEENNVNQNKHYITGLLNGSAKLSGEGQSTAKVISTLNGDAKISITKGTISHLAIEFLGLDVAQSLGLILRGDKALEMECAVVAVRAKQGVVTPSIALVDTPVTALVADGNINMANEELDLRLLAKPKNFSPLTLRSPILIKGTFANPETSIDKGPVAAKVAGSIFLGLLNPLAAILPLIDFGEGVDPSTESNCQQSLKGLQLPASAGKQAEINTKESNKSSQPQSNSKEAIEALF